MRRKLDRIAAVGAGVSAGTAALLVTGAGWWIHAGGPAAFSSWFQLGTGVGLARAAGTVIAIFLVAWGAGTLVTLPLRRDITAASADLVELSHRLAAGQARLRPLRTGIVELDTVSEVIARRAHDMARSLAEERDFASDASHQLRTPLTALLMRLEEISETHEPDVAREEAMIAIAQVERLTRVVDDLLGRNRAGNGGRPPAVSLDSVIAALQREWQPAFEQARRSVHVHGERGLLVRMTPVALSQVLSTLLENSLMHGRGTVEVQARRSGPSVIVEVSDQGDGVPPTMAPHIFERSVSTGTSGSTGLGLALARDLAEANGGRLDLVQAQPPRFAIFLSEAVDP
ncbi:MAG: HAMP domain-containing histidine kinase [Intrasporangium sp.]|uniref:sensor histidine kinase n=1 Tax=Intrasporangium sp. TaxID=1925024 RepID=UPI00264875E7|nr:HAMP domain-containing sensor histidine kinase [Intrasporangium sp.]MDN5794448.1 HAMP domain-containing histidine kinase [Intrasporangium sp.]